MTDETAPEGDEVSTAALEDPFERAKLRAMIVAYHARYLDEDLEVLFVEQEFRAPLVNPDTKAVSRTYDVGGKLDAGARKPGHARWMPVEHKSTSEDIGLDSAYWKRLRIDPQISTYYMGARTMRGPDGELYGDVESCLYDVLRKPALRPKKATAEIKLKKDGTPYANQTLADETPDEFERRCLESIAEDPDRHFMRGEVPRLEKDEYDAAVDLWHQARHLREVTLSGNHVRNPDACIRYGRECSYFGVCTGTAMIGDPNLFQRVERPHQELDAVADDGKKHLSLVTTSELRTFRRCSREHHYSYRLGYRDISTASPLRFGTAMHKSLEIWWKTCGNLNAALAIIDGIELPFGAGDTIPAPSMPDADLSSKLEASIAMAVGQ